MMWIKKHKFSELYEMSSGISSKPEQAGHGAHFLSFSTVFNNYFIPDQISDKMDTSLKEQEIYSIMEGDIFLTRTSETLDELGMSCVAIKDYPNSTYSGFLKRLRPNQDDVTYAKFMAFYLRSDLFRKTMTNNAIMTLRASLNEQIFSYLDLLLPSYDHQKSIGDLLFDISEKIELNNRINAELESMAKLIYDYWFVQFDFPISAAQAAAMGRPELEGKPYKSSGGKMVWKGELRRDVPEGWDVENLSAYGEFKNGVNYDPGVPGETTARIINVRNVSSSSIFISNHGLDYIKLRGNDVRKYLVDESTILIARSGIPGATRMIADYAENTIYCGFIISFNVDEIKNKTVLFYHLKDIEKAMTNKSAGTILKNVSQGTLKDLKFPMPGKHFDYVLNAFNSTIEPILGKINLIQKENQSLIELRDWLLPMLMNGQVRVREDEGVRMAAEPSAVYKTKAN